ncbi:uncharacterized protein BDR25DRAFT_205744, partial [Lindgomyces ingoldianus]
KGNWRDTPIPPGRTAAACHIMVARLKDSMKNEIAEIKSGQSTNTGDDDAAKTTPKKRGDADGTPKTAKSTPRKRKTKAEGDGECSPKKRGRKTKVVEEASEGYDATDGEPEIEAEADQKDGVLYT